MVLQVNMEKGNITKEKIRHASRDIFHRKGFSCTSIYDILESAEVKKGCLFFHYQSKKDLFFDVLDESLLDYENFIASGITQDTAVGQIEDILKAIADFHIKGGIEKGCMFGNLVLEVGKDDSEISDYLRKFFKKWEKCFQNRLIDAEQNGEIKLKEPAIVFARMILASIQGGVLLSKISGTTKPLTDCIGFVLSVIKERKVIIN